MWIVENFACYSFELQQLAIHVGFNVVASVDNSADALDIIFSDAPDIILMDIDIKGRLSGIDIAKRIHHLNIPVLYITSFGDDETYAEAMNILTDGSSYLLRIKLCEVVELLKDLKLIRCHRQFIVNQMKIQSVDIVHSTLKVGEDHIPLSRSKKQEILSIGIFIR